MNKKLLAEMTRRYNNGMDEGFTASNALFLLSLYNVCDDYVDEDKQAPLARAIETEMDRIFREEMKSDIGEVATAHIEEIREKWRMDG